MAKADRVHPGWRCSICYHNNHAAAMRCGGSRHIQVLRPKGAGNGWRHGMEHSPCGAKQL